MNINDLTIGQVKELTSFLPSNNPQMMQSNLSDGAIGKYAIVRTRNEGINFGKVIKADNTGIVLSEAQRIYYHKPKDNKTAWYEGVAQTGLDKSSKISAAVTEKYIIEDYSITMCSEDAIKSIQGHIPNGS